MRRFPSAIVAAALVLLALVGSGHLAARSAQKYRQRPRLPSGPPAKGMFLVAEDHVPEPFSRSVILLLAHGDTGTVGLIINRVTRVALSEVLPDLTPAAKQSHRLFFGGPVALNGLMFLYRSKRLPEASEHLMEDIYFGGDRSTLEKLAKGEKRPNELRLFLGYSGWAPGQLDAEILRGDWQVTRADAKTVFREDGDAIWRELIGRSRGSLVAAADFPHSRRSHGPCPPVSDLVVQQGLTDHGALTFCESPE